MSIRLIKPLSVTLFMLLSCMTTVDGEQSSSQDPSYAPADHELAIAFDRNDVDLPLKSPILHVFIKNASPNSVSFSRENVISAFHVSLFREGVLVPERSGMRHINFFGRRIQTLSPGEHIQFQYNLASHYTLEPGDYIVDFSVTIPDLRSEVLSQPSIKAFTLHIT